MAAGRVGATKASATAFLIPPVALLLGVLVRGEQVAALSVLGGIVCLAGAWLMRRAQMEPVGRAPRHQPPRSGLAGHRLQHQSGDPTEIAQVGTQES
jgi:hypothetical protein